MGKIDYVEIRVKCKARTYSIGSAICGQSGKQAQYCIFLNRRSKSGLIIFGSNFKNIV